MQLAVEPNIVALWSLDEIKGKTDDELLKGVWALESLYKSRDNSPDHRRYLSRDELENVFTLVQHLVKLRLPHPNRPR